MKIVIGNDNAAVYLKNHIKKILLSKGYEVTDLGVMNDTDEKLYPDVAFELASRIQVGDFERGILICGTGIGMSISANKVPGIRAAVCHDIYSTERSRKSNNAQIMCLGSRVVAPELAELLVERWLECEFQEGGSKIKVDRINELDGSNWFYWMNAKSC